MPTGYRVSLGNNRLEAGDSGTVSTTTFTTEQMIGTGSVNVNYTTFWIFTDNRTVTGTYYLGKDGNVYFVPDEPFPNNVNSVVVQDAPTFSIYMGTSDDDILTGGDESDLIYGGSTTNVSTGTGADCATCGLEIHWRHDHASWHSHLI
jgi:hypothetical protein